VSTGRYDAIVIGAGIVGAAAARALALAGLRVLLPERGWPGGEATAAAAGMLAPQARFRPGDPLLPLAVAARDRYASLVGELSAVAPSGLGYRACGVALVACDAARAAGLEILADAQRAAGLDATWLDRAALAKRHPGIGPAVVGALLAPRDGAIDNVALGAALLASGARAGVEFAEREEALELLVRGGQVTGVRTSRAVREAPTVVLAAGAWTPSIQGLPRILPVTPARGQMALVAWPEGEPDGVLFGPRCFALRRGTDAILGDTMEWAGFEPATTEAGMDEIWRETGAILPALLGQPVRKMWAGLRPMTPDGRPIIGRDPEVQGLLYATGHGRNGILLGPITGEIIRDLAVKGETSHELAPFAVQRFAPGP
jgi:glycine oxidase